MNSKIINTLKLLFTPLALAFLIYFAWQSRDELADLLANASLFGLLLAALAWAVLHAVSPMLAALVLSDCGSKISWRQAFATHAARLPARYLPGGVWHTVARVVDYRDQGVAGRHLSAFVILENGLAAFVTLAVGGAIVFSTRGADPLGVVAALSSGASLLMLPVMFYAINTRVLQTAERLSSATLAKSLLIVAVFWLIAATAFLLYIDSFGTVSGDYSLLETAGIYLFSWGIGFISIFAPQGIGIFEVVASELMGSPLGLMGLATLIAGFRVIVLVGDIAVWLIYLATRRAG